MRDESNVVIIYAQCLLVKMRTVGEKGKLNYRKSIDVALEMVRRHMGSSLAERISLSVLTDYMEILRDNNPGPTVL